METPKERVVIPTWIWREGLLKIYTRKKQCRMLKIISNPLSDEQRGYICQDSKEKQRAYSKEANVWRVYLQRSFISKQQLISALE